MGTFLIGYFVICAVLAVMCLVGIILGGITICRSYRIYKKYSARANNEECAGEFREIWATYKKESEESLTVNIDDKLKKDVVSLSGILNDYLKTLNAGFVNHKSPNLLSEVLEKRRAFENMYDKCDHRLQISEIEHPELYKEYEQLRRILSNLKNSAKIELPNKIGVVIAYISTLRTNGHLLNGFIDRMNRITYKENKESERLRNLDLSVEKMLRRLEMADNYLRKVEKNYKNKAKSFFSISFSILLLCMKIQLIIAGLALLVYGLGYFIFKIATLFISNGNADMSANVSECFKMMSPVISSAMMSIVGTVMILILLGMALYVIYLCISEITRQFSKYVRLIFGGWKLMSRIIFSEELSVRDLMNDMDDLLHPSEHMWKTPTLVDIIFGRSDDM